MKNNIVLITSTRIGILQATTLRFKKDNYRVLVSDILEEEGQKTVEQIENDDGM